jgi:uncharacterized protein
LAYFRRRPQQVPKILLLDVTSDVSAHNQPPPVIAKTLQRNYTSPMSGLHFEWDDEKAAANVKKHGINFEEAKSVFRDERAKLISDPDHSESEDRFVLLGLSETLRLLVVCHCYRGENHVIRIISARKATTRESESYR